MWPPLPDLFECVELPALKMAAREAGLRPILFDEETIVVANQGSWLLKQERPCVVTSHGLSAEIPEVRRYIRAQRTEGLPEKTYMLFERIDLEREPAQESGVIYAMSEFQYDTTTHQGFERRVVCTQDGVLSHLSCKHYFGHQFETMIVGSVGADSICSVNRFFDRGLKPDFSVTKTHSFHLVRPAGGYAMSLYVNGKLSYTHALRSAEELTALTQNGSFNVTAPGSLFQSDAPVRFEISKGICSVTSGDMTWRMPFVPMDFPADLRITPGAAIPLVIGEMAGLWHQAFDWYGTVLAQDM